MIDTNEQQCSSSTKLQLIDLDIADIRESSFDYVKEELINYQNSNSESPSIKVGLDDAQNIILESTKTLLAEKYINYFNLVNNRSIDEIVTQLIKNYTNFLQKQYKYQTNISDADLHKLLDKNPGSALFSAYDLADYLIDNIEYIDGVLLQDFQNHVDDSSVYNYLMEGILARLPKINTIKSSTINNIQNLLQTKDFHVDQSLSDVIMTKLYKIITHNDCKFNINFDEPIKYCVLINMLPKNITSKQHIVMPLSALPNLTVTMTDTKHHIKYKVFNEDNLQTLIDELLNSPDLTAVEQIINLGLNIELSVNDKENISKMITTINNTFVNSNRLQAVAKVLRSVIA